MIYTHVAARKGDYHPPDGAERVYLTWEERQRRVLRLRTLSGRSVGIELPEAGMLRHGDLLGGTSGESSVPLIVEAAGELVMAVVLDNVEAAALAGHIIGNRHLPVWIGRSELVVRRDHVLAETLRKAGFTVEEGERVLDEASYVASGGGHTPHGH